ncbi:unnamed protein product [Cylindrotheca closterium]|uniref:PHD-type domain-containing protein n=1 Tax=Cylindrotheca closterium TaxID=2856 RepID=A0AAD2CY62_9STRA|nr:unnamed protein product [Cylindrotheca closterium]
MPARSFRLDKTVTGSSRIEANKNRVPRCSLQSPPDKPATVTPAKSSKPSRIRKQTEYFNPLEENKKPQHKQSTKTPTKQKIDNDRPVPINFKIEEGTLTLKPLSKEFLCYHCNFGGELLQCHHASIAGDIPEIGCGKVVHPFCVGREEIPKGGWICTTCCVRHDHNVKMPKELRNKDIVDYGYSFSDESDFNLQEQQFQFEQAMEEWKQRKPSTAGNLMWRPKNLSGSMFDDEYIEDEEGDADSSVHSVGPCDVCKEEGELIRCHSLLAGIGCGKGVHMYCVFREEMPEGDWVCEDCARVNNLNLDKQYPAMGYEYPSESLDSIPKGEDTFDWDEDLGHRIQVGSRIGVYDEEDDEYENGTLVSKDMGRGVFRLLFDDGERRTESMRGRRIRLLFEKEISYKDLKLKMRLSLDPSLSHYIICGGGVTRAHNRKHAHRLLEHYVDVLLDDNSTTSLEMEDSDNDVMCQEVLEKLKNDSIEFIQWDAALGGFGKASKGEIQKKITFAFDEKREERARMPVQPTVIPQDDAPILHALLVNGGRPLSNVPQIPRKSVADDPFSVVERLHNRYRRHCARESGIISMQCFSDTLDESELIESASALIRLHQKEVISSIWDSDIFDDAEVEQSQDRSTAKVLTRFSLPQRMFQQNLKERNRKEAMSEIPGLSGGKFEPLVLTQSVPPNRKRGQPSKESTPSKKLKTVPKGPTAHTNSTNRKVRVLKHQVNQWETQLKTAARFRKKHGHCNIPSVYPPDPGLASWAKRQRHQYQLYHRKYDRCTMTPERIEALGKIDFCFDKQQIKWFQRFEELKAYRKKHGHTRVVSTDKPEQQLRAWIKHQRSQKKQFDQGLATFINQSRIDKLDSIDFCWHIRGLKNAEPSIPAKKLPATDRNVKNNVTKSRDPGARSSRHTDQKSTRLSSRARKPRK